MTTVAESRESEGEILGFSLEEPNWGARQGAVRSRPRHPKRARDLVVALSHLQAECAAERPGNIH